MRRRRSRFERPDRWDSAVPTIIRQLPIPEQLTEVPVPGGIDRIMPWQIAVPISLPPALLKS
jgi:hypothetical protein